MAQDEEKKVLINVDVNAPGLKEIAKLREHVDGLKVAQGELDRTTEEGRLEYERLSAEIKANNAELSKHQQAVKKAAEAKKEEEGSIKQLRAQLSSATAEYVRMSTAEREGASGKEMSEKIRKTSDELKELEKVLGDNRRNVGNYDEAIKKAMSGASMSIGELKIQLLELRKISFADKTEEEIEKIKQAIGETKKKIIDATNDINTYVNNLSSGVASVVVRSLPAPTCTFQAEPLPRGTACSGCRFHFCCP